MNQFTILQKFQLIEFVSFLNDPRKTSFRFVINDDQYIDVQFDDSENCGTQIKGMLKILYNKLPVLLERQKQIHSQYASSFRLRIDEDCITKNNEINFPIIGIKDNLINNPLFCDQKVFFENLEYQLQSNNGYYEIMIDAEEFGVILILSKLRKLIIKHHQFLNDAQFDIILYPSKNNFAIIRQNKYLYFYDEYHKELFLKQNSKYANIEIINYYNKIQFAYNKNIEIPDEDDQQEKSNQNQQCFNSEYEKRETLQLNYQLFKIYQTAELIEKGQLIKNRSNWYFRKQLSIKKNFYDQFIVIRNQINFCFSMQCKSKNIFDHYVEIQNDSILKCVCGQLITVDNFDLLVIDSLLVDRIKKIQDILLLNNRLDSCLFGYPIHIEKKKQQNRNHLIEAYADQNFLFGVEQVFYWRNIEKDVDENNEYSKRELFEIQNYSTEEDWEDECTKQLLIPDRNKTNE